MGNSAQRFEGAKLGEFQVARIDSEIEKLIEVSKSVAEMVVPDRDSHFLNMDYASIGGINPGPWLFFGTITILLLCLVYLVTRGKCYKYILCPRQESSMELDEYSENQLELYGQNYTGDEEDGRF